jgi:hypothetical protein
MVKDLSVPFAVKFWPVTSTTERAAPDVGVMVRAAGVMAATVIETGWHTEFALKSTAQTVNV